MRRQWIFLYLCMVVNTSLAQVVINEVGIAPAGGSSSQFIELYNRSGCAIDLSCYSLICSSTSSGGNATGWTIKIPFGKSVAPGGFFIIGGTAGSAGVISGTGYPTGGTLNAYPTADVNVGSNGITANAVYMRQGLSAGSLPNTKGQLSLLDAAGVLQWSVSYNSGNNPASYPLSSYTTCLPASNTKGSGNINNPGNAINNITATFSSTTRQGIFLNANGIYQTETSLTPATSNNANGGSQICSGPVLTSTNFLTTCVSANEQTVPLSFISSNSPSNYSLSWDALPANSFATVSNGVMVNNRIDIAIPAATLPGVYTGWLTLLNSCGTSCAKSFTVTVRDKPIVNAGVYAPACTNSGPILLNGIPVGGIFSGNGVTGNSFTPSGPGNYPIYYSYTDVATGCTNTASTIIPVAPPTVTYTTACTNTMPFIFQGQVLHTEGLHVVLLNNTNHCTDTAKIYLTVKQTIGVDTAGCNMVLYEGISYTTDTILKQAISSLVTRCDSLEKIINISIKQPTTKDTTVCLPANHTFILLGQAFTKSGKYTLHTTNAQGCDSTIHLTVVVPTLQTVDTSGCETVYYNGVVYHQDTRLKVITTCIITGCDSIIQEVNVFIKKKTNSLTTACLTSGQKYFFNGQSYNLSGLYAHHFMNAEGCDSLAQLYLVVQNFQVNVISNCHDVLYKGVRYTTSSIIYDTTKSSITYCDSLVTKVVINIIPQLHTNIFDCAVMGSAYLFHRQTLSTTGNYTALLKSTAGCDSFVHLYLVFKNTFTQTITGCDSVKFNGHIFYQNTSLSDTIRSVISSCDSIIHLTIIKVHQRPSLTVSATKFICLGDTATLTATSNAVVTWSGFATGHSIIVSPATTTIYTATAIDINGCSATITTKVQIEKFNLHLTASTASPLSGKPIYVQTNAVMPYTIKAWLPTNLFLYQQKKNQEISADSSLQISAIGSSPNGCLDTAYLHLTIIPFDDVFIPNAFTPNNDGKNDVLRVIGSSIANIDFKLYNRYGQLLFFSKDKNAGWDGMYKGMPQAPGGYIYVVRIKKTNGQLVEKKGTVELIR